MNANIATTELLTIDPKEFVDISYKTFTVALDEAIAKVPALTYDISTKTGMATAKEGRAMFREIRISLEKKRAAAKAPILEIGKLLDTRAKEIAQKIEPFELQFDKDIKAEEYRIEAEKKEKARVETERQERIQAMIDKLREYPVSASSCSAARLEELIAELSHTDITEELYGDRAKEGVFVREQSLAQMKSMLEGKKAQEQLAAQVEAQRIENERLAKIAAEEKAAAEAKVREEQAAQADALKAQQEEIERQRAEIAAQNKAIEEKRAALNAAIAAKDHGDTNTNTAGNTAPSLDDVLTATAPAEIAQAIATCGNPATAEPCTDPNKDQCGECLAFNADDKPDSKGQVCPSAEAMTKVIASAFGVDTATAESWLLATFGKAERTGIEMQPVESSQIAAIGHDPATNTLAIQFAAKAGTGSVYHYSNFTAADFEAFRTAKSPGKHFGEFIKPCIDKYPYVKVSA